MTDPRDMLDEMATLGATANEIGVYWYLLLYAKQEQSNPVALSKGELRERCGMTAQELQKTLQALQDDYFLIEILKNAKGGRGRGLEIRIIPHEKYVRPNVLLKDIIENYSPEDDPTKWEPKDVVKKFMEYWEECYGTPYVANWGRDCSLVKNVMFGKFNLTGEQIWIMFEYVFVTKKGHLFGDDRKIYTLGALASLDIVNQVLPDAVAYSKKKKRLRESPSVTKLRKELEEKKELEGK